MANKKGLTMVEVLVFITILSILFVAAATITTYSLRNIQFNQHKIIASHYAEEAMEWAKSEKEADWSTLITRDTSGGTGTTYCINSLGWTNGSPCGTDFSLGTPAIYKREILIANNGTSQVNVTITVYWQEQTNVSTVVLTNNFYQTE